MDSMLRAQFDHLKRKVGTCQAGAVCMTSTFSSNRETGARRAKVNIPNAAAPQPAEDDLPSVMLDDVKLGASAKLD